MTYLTVSELVQHKSLVPSQRQETMRFGKTMLCSFSNWRYIHILAIQEVWLSNQVEFIS